MISPGGSKRAAELWISSKKAGALGDIAYLARPEPEAAAAFRSDVAMLLRVTREQRAPMCENLNGDPAGSVFAVANHDICCCQSSFLHARRQDANPRH